LIQLIFEHSFHSLFGSQNLFKLNLSQVDMKAGRKATGGKYKRPKKRKKTGRQNESRVVKLGDQKTKLLRGRGGTKKLVAMTDDTVNVVKNGKAHKTEIKNVLETPSNTFLARQNVLVKGAVIETELGKAKITNRPSQEGFVQAVIVD
jgi:small subunit ribosomal protein S8e